MESNKSSLTALVSAFGRAYHSLCDEPKIFNDYLARELITDDEFTKISGYMTEGIKFFNPEKAKDFSEIQETLKWVIQTQIAPTPLARARYCEEMLDNAIMIGAKQYVILGAGMGIFDMLKLISSISVKGSSIFFDYADEYLFCSGVKRVQNMVAMAQSNGEIMKSCYNYSELEVILEKVNLLIYEHLTPKDIEARYFQNRNDYLHAFENINYALAVVK